LADFEQALTIEPKNALSHNARGLLLEKMGRPDAALADFERAVQLDGAANVATKNRTHQQPNIFCSDVFAACYLFHCDHQAF